VSEADVNGHLLRSFSYSSVIDVDLPYHLSVADDDNMLVADCYNHRVLLFDTKLQLERVLIDNNSSPLKLWRPRRLCYSPVTSLLHVVHSSSEWWLYPSDMISLFRLR